VRSPSRAAIVSARGSALAVAIAAFFPDRMAFGSQVPRWRCSPARSTIGFAGIVSLGHAAFFGLMPIRRRCSPSAAAGRADLRLRRRRRRRGGGAARALLPLSRDHALVLTLTTTSMLQELGNTPRDPPAAMTACRPAFRPLLACSTTLYGHVAYLTRSPCCSCCSWRCG
jgi:hypothetical protein